MMLCYIFFIFVQIYASFGSDNILGCGGFVKSKLDIDFSLINIKLYSYNIKTQAIGSLKYETDCAPNNGYYFVPIYEKGDFLLKVVAPPGWTFDPSEIQLHIDGKTDKCSLEKDINIQFIGFNLEGQVLSKNCNSGPSGVDLKLMHINKSIIENSKSSAGGRFIFEALSPGEYLIEASHSKWIFENDITKVLITDKQQAEFLQKLIVIGYDVKGFVENEAEPIAGVAFVLVGNNKNQLIKGCSYDIPSGFKLDVPDDIICYVISDKSGMFNFPNVEVGHYFIHPFYKGQNYKFDVHPKVLGIEVTHNSVLIKQKFQVQGFEVQGKVWCGLQNKGIKDAKIYIDGRKVSVSGADGAFILNNIRSIEYIITVISDDYEFDPVSFKLSPNNPLKPLHPSRYKVEGKIDQNGLPSQLSGSREVIIKKGSEIIMTLKSSEDGRFRCFLEPGDYIAQVVMSTSETKMRLSFFPKEKQFTVSGQTVDFIFSYFKSKIAGHVKCLVTCNQLEVILMPQNNGETITNIPVESDGSFGINEVQPGEYELKVLKENWCFENTVVHLTVEANSVYEIKFKHTGYALTLESSHFTNCEIRKEGLPEEKFTCHKGQTRICLPSEGQYRIRPVSCHIFSPSDVTWHTDEPTTIKLIAVQHTATGSVYTQDLASDLALEIETDEGEELLRSHSAPIFQNGMYQYLFSLKVAPSTTFSVFPISSNLLYQPDTKISVTVMDDCLDEAFIFTGRKGVFFSGIIKPALEGVSVVAFKEGTSSILQTVYSDSVGAYKLGPFSPDIKVKLVADKTGYTFQSNQEGIFIGHKLSEVVIHVKDLETNEPLQGVLVTLSGGIDYRQNVLTGIDGSVSFTGLNPGEYFFKPIMKEYKLTPSSKMITVKDGEDEYEPVFGKRVSFSCLGKLISLSGDPERDIYMQAVGSNHCSSHTEDAVSDENGEFRIRGLHPGCGYDISIKSCDRNNLIERSSPKSTTIQITDADVKDINFIILRKAPFMDITVHVNTTEELLPSLRLKLFPEENPSNVLYLHKFEHGPFIALPRITTDSRVYVISIESSLSKKIFSYGDQEVTFIANSSYRHFIFNFEPRSLIPEQELTQGSYLAVPITILLVLIGICHKQFQPLLLALITFLSEKIRGDSYLGSDSVFFRKKVKPKRL